MRWRFAVGVVFVLFGIISSAPTIAQSDELAFPTFDPEKACHNQLESMSGNSNFNHYFNECIDDEQTGYDYLKSIWPNVDYNDKKECLKRTFYGNHVEYQRYSLLASCIQTFDSISRTKREKPMLFVP